MRALGFIETKGLVGNIEATDAMLKAADELLYDCKENGRNQIRTKDLTKQTEKDS